MKLARRHGRKIRRPPSRPCLGLACAALLGAAAPARAHPQYALSTVNRYSKLVLQPDRLRLIYTLMIGDVPAYALRQRADGNRDGQVDAREEAVLAAELAQQAAAGLHLWLDGQAVPVRLGPPTSGLSGREVAPAALSVDLEAMVALRGSGTHDVRLEDRTALLPIGEVEVSIEASPGVQMLAAYQGRPAQPSEGSEGLRTRFQTYGAPASSLVDRSVSLRFRSSGAPAQPTRPYQGSWPRLSVMLLVGLLVMAIGAVGGRRWVRAQRRMKG